MSKEVDLIHPIYLDVPMITSFLAALNDGISYGIDVTRKQDTQKTAGAEAEANAGTSGIPILSSLFNFDLRGKINENNSAGNSEEIKLIKKHTESSLFMSLRQTLKTQEIIKMPFSLQDLSIISHGDLIEITGQIYRSPLSEALDAIIRVLGLLGVDLSKEEPTNQGQTGASVRSQPKRGTAKQIQSVAPTDPIDQLFTNKQALFAIKMAERMRDDLIHSKVQDMLMKPSIASDFQVVAALSTEFLSDTSAQTLLSGEYTLLGKVSRVLTEDEELSLYQRTTLSYINNKFMDTFIHSMKQQDFIYLREDLSVVKAPLIQVIPLAIFV